MTKESKNLKLSEVEVGYLSHTIDKLRNLEAELKRRMVVVLESHGIKPGPQVGIDIKNQRIIIRKKKVVPVKPLRP